MLIGGWIAWFLIVFLGLINIPYIYLAVYFGLVYLLASGIVFRGYKTQKPLKTAFTALVIAVIIHILLVMGLLAIIGITFIDDIIIMSMIAGG